MVAKSVTTRAIADLLAVDGGPRRRELLAIARATVSSGMPGDQ